MPIVELDPFLIDQIAAGEVVERPASVVKELVENALDAGARRIQIATAGGGKTLLRVTDDGNGIPREELRLAVRRHCTSKLSGGLDKIATLGFRGEALPSIGSVARLSVASRAKGADDAFEVVVEAGHCEGPKPAALTKGTVVEVRGLFQSVPARLKFLKSDRAEAQAITETVKRLAIAFPGVRFELSGPDRSRTLFEAVAPEAALTRIGAVVGEDFAENAVEIDAERDGVFLSGFAGLPTFNRGNSLAQYFYVNGRPVRDRTLVSALAGAYADMVAKGRYGVAVLFIELDPALVDVNVHPAKADVRFRDPGLVRGLIVGALREAFAREGVRGSTANADGLLGRFSGGVPRQGGDASSKAPAPAATPRFADLAPGAALGRDVSSRPRLDFGAYRPPERPRTPFEAASAAYRPLETQPQGAGETAAAYKPGDSSGKLTGQDHGFGESSQTAYRSEEPAVAAHAGERTPEEPATHFPLGAAKAQLFGNFIVAETEDGLVLVDQHAAHERLVYERLKTALYGKALASQLLLLPEIVELPEDDCDRLAEEADTFRSLGLSLERFGAGAVAVRETPAILGQCDVKRLVKDLADELAEFGTGDSVKSRIDHVAATIACHGSVRSGRQLRPEEMNALLREMEATPGSGQCNHGRPTFIELKLADIESLFGRR
ncbi:DNA mismatch repair protein MutL [Fulvimarina manganoxydans]|uniref:DNA mismatch repair protein MutL n=1 Tax=Fulvimarina manganoxydans TaxID=937218 RepID=A0A1W2EJV1_9HYPH|nr:DNA mismatch repair endonuclease MutL [Fulvimarina manganoxydans]SMD09576.1 DNA mismatch repair protein MutL [Fulvimarina manganoxydans]